MEYKGQERRECNRFKIPGAAVNYSLKKSSSSTKKENEETNWEEEFCPVLDMSCGGLRFQAKKPLEINSEMTVKISIPGEHLPLTLNGQVRWLSYDNDKNIYQFGIGFNPYGEKEGQNYPGLMVKILALEQKFSTPGKSDTEKFEIEG
ncbi:MAG: PilZ domain-containing protein [Candidatus Aminicenantaceae bacterium]